MDKKLDDRPARELTSREASKIIGATLGGLAGMCPPETIFAALDFYVTEENQVQLETVWRSIWEMSVQQGTVIPEEK